MPTSFRRNIRFQPKQEERLDEFNFTGGLVTDTHETKLQSNQSPNMQNVIFNDTGSIKTRNGYTRYNGDPIGITSDQSNTGASAGTLSIAGINDYVAQTFIPSTSINCLQVNVYLAMNTSGQEQRVRIELWSTSTSPSSILTNLAKSQILNISGTSETAYSFRINTPIALSASTTYALVIKPYRSSSTATINQVNVHRTGSAYANGQVYTSTDAGVSWTGASSQDLKFVVYRAGDTGSTGLIRYYGPAGIQQLIAKYGSTLYRGNDGTGAMTAITLGNGSSLNASNFIDWTVSNGTLLVVDRSSRIQKYRGSTNANYSTGTISVTNGSSTVTGSGTSWNTTTNAEAGEYIKLPDGKWYKISSIGSNTSITIEVSYQGSTLSGQSYTISPWGEIQGKLGTSTANTSLVRPTPYFIENHANRIWTLEGNTLRFSALDTSITEEHFNDWDTSNNAGAIIVPTGNGDTGTGLYSLGNALYVFQKRSIWAVYGTSPANFELRNITHEIGMLDKRSLVEWNNILIFLSEQGLQFFDGTNTRNVSDGVVNSLIDSWASKTTPVATLWENKYMICYTPSGGTYNSEALILDLTRNAYTKATNIHASAFSSWKGGTDTGQIYFGSSNQGSLYRWDIGSNDDKYEIHTLYDMPSIGFGANVNDKTMKKVYLQQLAKGDYNMSVTMFADITGTETTTDINLSGGSSSLWDVFEWDTDSWSSEGSIITSRLAEFQGIAKFFKFRIEEEGIDTGIECLGVTITERTRRLA
jgi:hypothetical protein